jgi:hypothetical protein
LASKPPDRRELSREESGQIFAILAQNLQTAIPKRRDDLPEDDANRWPQYPSDIHRKNAYLKVFFSLFRFFLFTAWFFTTNDALGFV